ncbi:MAG: TSUP family transporter [Pyrinomonadaceae bacterium]
MEYVIICLAAFLASALTFFSGFGLGTILMPVFALFFPVEVAIGLTAIVHFLNGLFKVGLVGRNADRKVVLYFGIPAALAALVGAAVLALQSTLTFDRNTNYLLLASATVSAFIGAFLGNRLLKKITMDAVRWIVSIMLIVISVLLGAGII